MQIKTVLIANRGEIAVRIARVAHDLGIKSIAIYSEADAGALHTQVADEAYALPGNTAADTYMNIPALLDIAVRAGADAIHPGYGFLSENADFARTVTDAGMIWIGPSPESIELLGDKIAARRVAEEVGAPLAPGTSDPIDDWQEARAFAEEHGLPIAIKAAYGGGGRGLKVVDSMDEIEGAFNSAGREAMEAFGRAECYVEKFLTHPRHVEAQVLADTHGNVRVLGTRDCSTQRRFQKLIEEAPAPALSDAQRTGIIEGARSICSHVGYTGAGTVEYLVGADGLISFLEVNTRLQVEHPVSEETTGLDLVREQFRIAQGERLSLSEDPAPRGHAFEFRINGEDAAAGFMPAPGTIVKYSEPAGPGVRVDSGVVEGSVIGGQFDSMLAKLIVWGPDRETALRRSARALSEYQVEGLPTVLPFDRAIVADPAFTAENGSFDVYTKWIEESWDNQLTPHDDSTDAEAGAPEASQVHTVEIDGRRIEVALPATFGITGARKRKKRKGAGAKAAVSGDAVTAPMQGTVIKVNVEEGQEVEEGDIVLVLEAMKMENPVKAHKSGTVTGLAVEAGSSTTKGAQLLEIK